MNRKPRALVLLPPLPGLREALVHCCTPAFADSAEAAASLLASEAETFEIVVVAGRLDPSLTARLPRLGLVAAIGAGYDGIDIAALQSRGIAVSYGPRTNHRDVADAAIGLMIAVVRKLAEGDRLIRAGAWTGSLQLPMTPSLRDLRYGIFGLGAVGEALAERLAGFGGPVSWWGPTAKPEVGWPRSASLDELAEISDVLFVTARLTPQSRGAVNARILERLGRGGYLINVARGDIVDEPALLAALRAGRIAGAGLDVFAAEPTASESWKGLPNLVLTPHIAAWTAGTLRDSIQLLARNIGNFAAGKPLVSPVPVGG